ncbi:MAG: TetR/AcrR family transcriptional regulator [Pseudomonas sp.]|uniref:TetR/AcrR family transcriptional regulator n=1 Tax=Pseudomonas sp. TaxID=306 RepID=UPI003D0B96C5
MHPVSPLDPRKLPVQARAQATYDAILQSGTQLLSTTGLENFNTNAIADRAGASIGTFYQYFPNKEAVLLALIRLQKREMFANISAAMRAASGHGLDEAVRLMISGRIKHLRGNGQAAWILSQQEMLLPIPEVKADYLMQGSQMFRCGLVHWGDAVKGVDPMRISRTIPAMIRGIMEGWIQESPHHLDAAEQEAVDSVLGYLEHQLRR